MSLTLTAIPDMPLFKEGDDVGLLTLAALSRAGFELQEDDVLVVAQKVVSKAEGRLVGLNSVMPGAAARELAQRTGKDPRLVELILRESNEVIRAVPGVLIVEHRLGFIHANAGIDRSNVQDGDAALLLPLDPDLSAAAIRQTVFDRTGTSIAVIINDSAGRAWRNGVIGFAIGCAGINPVHNAVGFPDLYGRNLEVTEIAVADELAAAASHLMGQGAEGQPAVVIRGARFDSSSAGMRALIRNRANDLFR